MHFMTCSIQQISSGTLCSNRFWVVSCGGGLQHVAGPVRKGKLVHLDRKTEAQHRKERQSRAHLDFFCFPLDLVANMKCCQLQSCS